MAESIQSKIEALLQVAQADRGPARGPARAQIGNQLGEILADAPSAFDPSAFQIAADIVRHLIRETEAEIRQRLAESLAANPDAPRDLVLALANDEIQIARPLLTMSAALNDADLIEIIRQRGSAHSLAIAAREEIGAGVSAALVETGDADVMAELLANRSAEIAAATYAYLADFARENERLQSGLVTREDLPSELAAKLYGWVAADLKRQIRERYAFQPDAGLSPNWSSEVEWAIDEAVGNAAADHGEAMAWGSSADRLADTIKAERLNDPAILVRTLRQGHVSLFEALFARFAELPMRLSRRVLYQADGRALAVAARALGMERAQYLVLARLVRRTSTSEGRVMPESADAKFDPPAEAVAMFERLGLPESLDIMKRWRSRQAQPAPARGLPWARRVEQTGPLG
ncbi:MAG: DUF2336 domain-containing protein [Magnetospirillum sp.]|jgi:uncharacterized protein (DUF2336 family)|nr:DUF2336 domain-containing protein [Magnetospirillum sp.]